MWSAAEPETCECSTFRSIYNGAEEPLPALCHSLSISFCRSLSSFRVDAAVDQLFKLIPFNSLPLSGIGLFSFQINDL